MRKSRPILFTLTLLTLMSSLEAQTKVNFNIRHLFGQKAFTLDNIGVNDLNTPYKIERLEYYISEIVLVHDGGIETAVDDYWILADVTKRANYELGSFDIQHLEKIIFHIGVDPAHNNEDPSVYPPDHPLALKDPAMHWGWAAGYIFIALNGNGGDNFDNPFQVHALGNENYHTIELQMDADAVNGVLDIPINANYDMAMRSMDASIGIFYHGPTKFGAILATNFANYVFSKGESPASTNILSPAETQFSLLPNQVHGGNGVLKVEGNFGKTADLMITDGIGKVMGRFSSVSPGSIIEVNNLQSGLYFVTLVEKGIPSGTQKLLVY